MSGTLLRSILVLAVSLTVTISWAAPSFGQGAKSKASPAGAAAQPKAGGAQKPGAPVKKPKPAPSGASVKRKTAVKPPAATPPPGRVVFIAKRKCCACEGRRIKAGLAALKAAVGARRIRIERIDLDVTPAGAAPYRKLKLFFAVPALYFFDGKGRFKGMLQGFPTKAQIGKLLAQTNSSS